MFILFCHAYFFKQLFVQQCGRSKNDHLYRYCQQMVFYFIYSNSGFSVLIE